jgi:deoxycytidylate deaminase
MNTHQFFIDIAKVCARQSTCISSHYGAVIVNPETRHVISTGFNGVPKGKEHCKDKDWCFKRQLGFDHFQNSIKDYAGIQYCLCSHAEVNALVQAGERSNNCVMYLYGERNDAPFACQPCFQCTKLLINAGIAKVIIQLPNTFVEIDPNGLYDRYVNEIADTFINQSI